VNAFNLVLACFCFDTIIILVNKDSYKLWKLSAMQSVVFVFRRRRVVFNRYSVDS